MRAAERIIIMGTPLGGASGLVIPSGQFKSIGSYSVFASTFNGGSFTQGVDYDAKWTIQPAQFPNKTVLNWYTPKGTIPNAGGEWGYHHLDFGNYDASVQQVTVQPQMICDMTTFSTSFDWSYTGSSEFNLLHEMWPINRASTSASNSGSPLWEVGLLLHAGTTGAAFHAAGTLIGTTHVNNGVTYTVRSHGTFITIWAGADVLVGSFDWKALLNFLVTNGAISGSEWICGLAFGVEPTLETGTGTRTGQMNVNSYSETMTGNSATTASRFAADYLGTNLITTGGNDLTGWSLDFVTSATGQADLNGGTTAIELLETIDNNNHGLFRSGANEPAVDTAAHDYIMFYDVFPVGRDVLELQFSASTFTQKVTGSFQFSTKAVTFVSAGGGTITGTFGQVIDLGGGWYRCLMKFHKASDATYAAAFIGAFGATAVGTDSYIGDITKGYTARARARLVQIA